MTSTESNTIRTARLIAAFSILLCCLALALSASAQSSLNGIPSSTVRIGERLSYGVTFERYRDIAFAETYVVSRGRLADRDAIELRSRVKTLDLLSAAFYSIDETRTTYIAAESGVPLFVRRVDNSGVQALESTSSYLSATAPGHDLLSLLFRIRAAGGAGTFVLVENDRTYPVTTQINGTERVKTDAGEFDTSAVTVQSEYLTELGIQGLRINLSNDEARLPVRFAFRTSKGQFVVTLSGLQMLTAPTETAPEPTPLPTPLPRPAETPRPAATPRPYVDNQPLDPEVGFALGERLVYRVTTAGRLIAEFQMHAKERKLFAGQDSLLLEGVVISAAAGNGTLAVGDRIAAQVDPETLAPRQFEMRFANGLVQSALFDQRTGTVTLDGAGKIDGPVGTHSILSLLYALRSFNLKPRHDLNNPGNDIRVAVFWRSKASTFVLRPAVPETIEINGQKVAAQLVTVNTGDAELDPLAPRVWLSVDERRVPLRIVIGPYQLDLAAAEKTVKP
ncbi:MAG: DUF3108 domain-containing protein [Pyrinomonadaceae bacterium]